MDYICPYKNQNEKNLLKFISWDMFILLCYFSPNDKFPKAGSPNTPFLRGGLGTQNCRNFIHLKTVNEPVI